MVIFLFLLNCFGKKNISALECSKDVFHITHTDNVIDLVVKLKIEDEFGCDFKLIKGGFVVDCVKEDKEYSFRCKEAGEYVLKAIHRDLQIYFEDFIIDTNNLDIEKVYVTKKYDKAVRKKELNFTSDQDLSHKVNYRDFVVRGSFMFDKLSYGKKDMQERYEAFFEQPYSVDTEDSKEDKDQEFASMMLQSLFRAMLPEKPKAIMDALSSKHKKKSDIHKDMNKGMEQMLDVLSPIFNKNGKK